jgi:hypothetical protein
MFTIMPILIIAAFVIILLVVITMAVLAFTGKIKLQGGGGSDSSDISFPGD